jgi:hypothetical protein
MRPVAARTALGVFCLAILLHDRCDCFLLFLWTLLDVHFISSLPVILRSACKAWGDREPVQIVVAED